MRKKTKRTTRVNPKKMKMTSERTTATRNKSSVDQAAIGDSRIQLPIPVQRRLLNLLLVQQ